MVKRKLRHKKRAKKQGRTERDHRIIARAAKRAGKLGNKRMTSRLGITIEKPTESLRPSMYRVLLHDALIAPERTGKKNRAVIAAAGTIVELMDMQVLFRDRVSPITRRADEILVRWGPRGKEQLGWLAKNVVIKPVKGPLFFARSTDKMVLKPWDRIRAFVAWADARQLHGQRWWLLPWLLANAAEYDDIIARAAREFGSRVKLHQADPDVLAGNLYRLTTNQEIDIMATKDIKTAGKKGKGKNAKPSKSKTQTTSKDHSKKAKSNVKLLPFVSQKNAKQYGREREYDSYIVKRLTKDNPHRAGTTQAKRWSLLKKGISVAEYVAKGGSRGTLHQWLSNGAAKLIRAGGAASGGE